MPVYIRNGNEWVFQAALGETVISGNDESLKKHNMRFNREKTIDWKV